MTGHRRKNPYVRREPGESMEHWKKRSWEFLSLTTDPHILVEATGPPTPEWSQAQINEWREALERTHPIWPGEE